MEKPPITFKPLSQCTFEQTTALWNSGFQHYYTNMQRTVEQVVKHIGMRYIHPTLSVAAFAGDEPAGFVMIGVTESGGKKLAWNGGTGVNPAFRGIGLAKRLVVEAVSGVRNAGGFDSALLEVVSQNASAIAAYEHGGFRIVDDLLVMKRAGSFEQVPFARTGGPHYVTRRERPVEASFLPFYLIRSAWGSQWFSFEVGESLLVYDLKGEIAAYALYSRNQDIHGKLTSIALYQCEPAPGREDAEQAVRFALAEVFAPFDMPINRVVNNLRGTNEPAVAALQEAGFATLHEQKLMWMDFV